MSRALATLRRADRTGQSAIIAITGEPGIGKTAVLKTIVEQARRMGFVTGYGKSEEIDQIAPGAPLLIALRSGAQPLLDREAFQGLAPLQDQPLWFVDQIAASIAEIAGRTPVLIAIDDAQWADRLSRFALRLLPARLAGLSVVWVLASREPSGELLEEWTAAATDGISLQHIVIDALTGETLDTIARDVLGAVPTGKALERLHSLGGNPLLAVQLLEGLAHAPQGGAQDVFPDSLIATVRHRTGTLSGDDLQLLRTVAVWGRPIDIDELTALIVEVPIESIWRSVEAATAVAIFTDDGGQVAFRHDLVREAVYLDVPDGARRALHRRSARFLLTHRGAVFAAPHALAAAAPGDEEAVVILRQAARDTKATHPESAAGLIRRAFHLLARPHPAWLAVGEECAGILAQAQHGREAVHVVDSMLDEPADPDTEARLQVIAADALWLMGLLEDSARRVEAALTRPGVSEPLILRLAAAKARVQTRTEGSLEATCAAEAVLEHARRIDDQPAELMALQALGEIAKNEGRHDKAYRYYHALRQGAGVSYLAQEVTQLQLLDRYDDADRLLASAERNRRHHPDTVMPSLVAARLWQNFYLGRFEEATANAKAIISLSNDLGTYVHKFDAWQLLSMMAAHGGDVGKARRVFRHLERAEADADVRVPGGLLVKSFISYAEGDAAEAVRLLEPMLDSADAARNYWPRSHGWVRIHAGMARQAGSEHFATQCVSRAEDAAQCNPGVASYRGLALQTRGYVERDATLLSEAVEVLRASPRPALLGSALADHGDVLLAIGCRDLAVERLTEAATVIDRDTYRLQHAAVLADLKRAGAPGPPPAATGAPGSRWATLTQTERAVAELVVAGHPNKGVASTLGISVNTVGTHLRSLFSKAEVHSRVQLTNAWNAHRGADD